MKITCHVMRQGVPAPLYELLAQVRSTARGGDTAMLRRLALIGMDLATQRPQEFQVRTATMVPCAGEGWTLVFRLPDDSDLARQLRTWSPQYLVTPGEAFLLLALWAWEHSRPRQTVPSPDATGGAS